MPDQRLEKTRATLPAGDAERMAEKYIKPMMERGAFRFEWRLVEDMRTKVPRVLPFGPWLQGER